MPCLTTGQLTTRPTALLTCWQLSMHGAILPAPPRRQRQPLPASLRVVSSCPAIPTRTLQFTMPPSRPPASKAQHCCLCRRPMATAQGRRGASQKNPPESRRFLPMHLPTSESDLYSFLNSFRLRYIRHLDRAPRSQYCREKSVFIRYPAHEAMQRDQEIRRLSEEMLRKRLLYVLLGHDRTSAG